MELEATLQKGLDLVQPWTQSVTSPEPNWRDVAVEVGGLLPAFGALLGAKWGFLTAITGLDQGPEAGKLEVLYSFPEGATVLTLRVAVPRDHAVIPSVCGLLPAASFFERELMEMFGVTCEGTPDVRRLFLAEEWPADVHPLRKDFIIPAAPAPKDSQEGSPA